MKAFLPESTFYFYRGRVALYALLRALDIGPGDEILIPGFTCIAVPSPILGMGARPVYVDIDPATYNMDPAVLAAKVTGRTKAIVAQHTFGIPCDMEAIMSIAEQHGLPVIEDACHVWGSTYQGRELGSIGVAAFYSYDPGKPFIIGMGGAATVNSERLRARLVEFYHEFKCPSAGEVAKLHLQYLAHRFTQDPRLFWTVRDVYRLLSRKGLAIATWTADTFEGKLGPDYQKGLAPSLQNRLLAMMSKADKVIARHQRLAKQYETGLHAMGIPGLSTPPGCEAVLICYPMQVTNKGALLEEARKARVELGDWFSSPVHPLAEDQWQAVGYEKGSCVEAEQVSRQVITLPCHAGVTAATAARTLQFLQGAKERGVFTPVQVSSSSAGVSRKVSL